MLDALATRNETMYMHVASPQLTGMLDDAACNV